MTSESAAQTHLKLMLMMMMLSTTHTASSCVSFIESLQPWAQLL